MKTKGSTLIIYKEIRNWRDKFLETPARLLLKWKISANFVTFFRLGLVIPMVFLVGVSAWWAVLIIVVNFFLDSLDGVMARLAKTASTRGRAFDVSIDDLYVVPLILGMLFYNLVNPFWSAFYLVNIIFNFFLNLLRYGIDVGSFPFSYSKYFFYLATLLLALNWGNYFDFVSLFWGIFLFVENLFLTYKLYKNDD